MCAPCYNKLDSFCLYFVAKVSREEVENLSGDFDWQSKSHSLLLLLLPKKKVKLKIIEKLSMLYCDSLYYTIMLVCLLPTRKKRRRRQLIPWLCLSVVFDKYLLSLQELLSLQSFFQTRWLLSLCVILTVKRRMFGHGGSVFNPQQSWEMSYFLWKWTIWQITSDDIFCQKNLAWFFLNLRSFFQILFKTLYFTVWKYLRRN